MDQEVVNSQLIDYAAIFVQFIVVAGFVITTIIIGIWQVYISFPPSTYACNIQFIARCNVPKSGNCKTRNYRKSCHGSCCGANKFTTRKVDVRF